ncbi:uroporphyrinogen-III synthase [Parvularcula sp. ZS-1/3]|uniref:Uroporphyrinogen-III synthase n=1 Tax=Parvularcula mediterranea TaxID=2732508 RepID=A0A7Y3W4T6_9PROT|nr:uroporphyrinogen-III synthase [Parvularcula mediterranea]
MADAAILVTRPEPGASDLVSRLTEAKAGRIFSAPMSTIEATGGEVDQGDASALLITSPRAITHADPLPELPVYAVGPASAEAARKAGLTVAGEGQSTVDETFLALIPDGTRLLHLSGERLATDPREPLEARGVRYRRQFVYAARAPQEAPAALADFLASNSPHFVTFLSALAAENFARLVRNRNLPPLAALCLSPRIAQTAEASGTFENVFTATDPDPALFVDFVSSRCT